MAELLDFLSYSRSTSGCSWSESLSVSLLSSLTQFSVGGGGGGGLWISTGVSIGDDFQTTVSGVTLIGGWSITGGVVEANSFVDLETEAEVVFGIRVVMVSVGDFAEATEATEAAREKWFLDPAGDGRDLAGEGDGEGDWMLLRFGGVMYRGALGILLFLGLATSGCGIFEVKILAGEATEEMLEPGVLDPDLEMDGEVLVYMGTFFTTGLTMRGRVLLALLFVLCGDIEVARSFFREAAATSARILLLASYLGLGCFAP